jgi:hypothetical protein
MASGLIDWRSADVDDLILGQCPGPVPALTCVAGNGGVRSSEKKPKGLRAVRGPHAVPPPQGFWLTGRIERSRSARKGADVAGEPVRTRCS